MPERDNNVMGVFAGIDIGSVTAKTVILDESEDIVSYNITEEGIVNQESAISSLTDALDKAGTTLDDVKAIITTGYGRDLINIKGKSITEITCHATGTYFISPKVRTIIDIGGQGNRFK